MRYSEYRAQARSLDIVLFSGKGRISEAIKWITKSDKSHIALTLHMHEYNCLALFESTTLSDTHDLLAGKPSKGVQLVNMSLRLNNYDGKVWVRPILGPRTHKQKKAAMDFMRNFHGRPYEKNQMELVRSAIDMPGTRFMKNEPDASSVFCSELTALMLRHVGIMNHNGEPANEFTPADFSKDFDLADGYKAGELIQLTP